MKIDVMAEERTDFEVWVKVVLPAASLSCHEGIYVNSLVEMARLGWLARAHRERRNNATEIMD